MKVFVWQKIENCTEHYHSEGGVVVFAETEERARWLANQDRIENGWTEQGCRIDPTEMPDYVAECPGADEKVFVFPNAGCC